MQDTRFRASYRLLRKDTSRLGEQGVRGAAVIGPAAKTSDHAQELKRWRCPDQAEVKLADSQGDSAWVCLPHAEEILVTVPTAFIASHDGHGAAAFLASH